MLQPPARRAAAVVDVAFEVSLWAKLSDESCICLYQSFGQLDDFAPWRNVVRALAKAANFPERVLARYQSKGELVTYTAEPIAISTSPVASYLVTARAVLRKVFHKLFYHEQWFIVVGKGQDLIPDPNKNQWF